MFTDYTSKQPESVRSIHLLHISPSNFQQTLYSRYQADRTANYFNNRLVR